jgi:hypothetical protein
MHGKNKMFLLQLGAPEGKDVPSPLILQEHLSGEKHIILQEHLSGEGTSYLSGPPKWGRNILSSLRCT